MKLKLDRNRTINALGGVGAGVQMVNPPSTLIIVAGWVLIGVAILNYLYESISFDGSRPVFKFREKLTATNVFLVLLFAVSVAGGAGLTSWITSGRQEKAIEVIARAAEVKRARLQGEADYRRMVISGKDGKGGLKRELAALKNELAIAKVNPPQAASSPAKPTTQPAQQACFHAGGDLVAAHNDLPGYRCDGPMTYSAGSQKFFDNSTRPIPEGFPPASAGDRALSVPQLKAKLNALADQIEGTIKTEPDKDKRLLNYKANFAAPVQSIVGSVVERYGPYPLVSEYAPKWYNDTFKTGDRIAKSGRPSGPDALESVVMFLRNMSKMVKDAPPSKP